MDSKQIKILALLLVPVVIITASVASGAQPKFQLTTNQMVVAEKLVVLKSPERTLIRNSDHLVMVRPSGDRVILVLEALSDRTNNLDGQFPKVDFVSIRVDVNRNGKVDPNVDVTYGIKGHTKDQLCTQYMLSDTSSTACGDFRSRASLKVAFKKTSYSPQPHPVWEFSIPTQELGLDNNFANLIITFHQANKGYIRYPKVGRTRASFAKVFMANLKPSVRPSSTTYTKVLKALPNSTLTDMVKVRPSSRTTAQDLLRTKDHLVTVKNVEEKVVFIMEALSRTKNYLKSEYPKKDFTSIRVDVNQNGKIDTNVDVAYGVQGGTYDKLCSQYLLKEGAETACGGFPSKASLRVAFRATLSNAVPHPVWEYSIPKNELGPENDRSHLTFVFHIARKGYARYPQTNASRHSFTDPLMMDLKSLQLIVPETEEESTIVTYDTNPPNLTVTLPPDVSSGEIKHDEKDIVIHGRATDESGIYEIQINNEEANVLADGSFDLKLKLSYGKNTIRIQATDLKDNTAEMSFVVLRSSTDDSRGGGVGETSIDEIDEAVMSVGVNYALLVANETYDDPDITDLDEPITDAEQLKDVLTNEYAFESSHVKLLRNQDKGTVVRELEEYAKTVQSEDNMLIFFAGHGQWDQQIEEGYWLLKDAADDSTAQWISNSDVRNYVRAIRSKHTLLITDACFSGGIFKTRGGLTGSDRAIAELYDMSSRKAMTSGTLTEVPDQSAFLEYMIKRLQDNTQKWISADQLFYRFREAVINNSPNTPQYGVIHDAGDEGGEFIFIRRTNGESQ